MTPPPYPASSASRDLASQANAFAEDLNRTITLIFGEETDTFESASLEDRVSIDNLRITMRRGGEPVLQVSARYLLSLDHRSDFLRVAQSQIRVVPVGVNRPVFRYEYEEGYEDGSPHPAAHVQFHGVHPDLQDVMSRAWRKKPRDADAPPDVTHLHFPVGGTRYRPCLEDVLEMLLVEFKLDVACGRKAALEVLADQRATWRRRQLATVVRDDPETAIDALVRLGYARPRLLPGVNQPPRHDEHLRRI